MQHNSLLAKIFILEYIRWIIDQRKDKKAGRTEADWIPAGVYPHENGGGNDEK